MPQNKNKLIELFISNLSTAIIHKILIDAIKDKSKEVANHYQKEIENAINISKKYRKKINPIKSPLSNRDISYIKTKITRKIKTELMNRISKGYKNINLNLIGELVNKMLKETEII